MGKFSLLWLETNIRHGDNMTSLRLYRKTDKKLPKLSETKIKELEKNLSLRRRLLRPSTTRFLLGGGFNRLEPTPSSILYNSWKRDYDDPADYFEIPVEDMGRLKREPDISTANSIKLWIQENLDISTEDFTIIPVEE